jgi:hypothetical protein
MTIRCPLPFVVAVGRSMAIAALAFLLTGYISVEALFAPKAELWERWTAHDPEANAVIDHGAWDAFLAAYVSEAEDGVNRVAYARVTDTDNKALGAYVAQLAATPISHYGRAEQRAYWINLYNALTVQIILDHYPVESIREIDISPGLFADGPWDKVLVQVESVAISLNDIEHRILRPIWRDPRLHYAVNCASLGCPNLQPVAFTAANAESLLESAARAYINHPRGARIVGGDLAVSSIYVWFQEDFGNSDAGVIAHVRQYADPDLAAGLNAIKRISGHDYDWHLNDGNDASSS